LSYLMRPHLRRKFNCHTRYKVVTTPPQITRWPVRASKSTGKIVPVLNYHSMKTYGGMEL